MTRAYDPRERQTFYSTVKPNETRVMTCREYECDPYVEGFKVIAPTIGPQADYIRASELRHFTETVEEAGISSFHFEAGQECFAEHRVAVLPPRLLHFNQRGGAQPPSRREIAEGKPWRPPDWLENFGETSERIAELRAREGI